MKLASSNLFEKDAKKIKDRKLAIVVKETIDKLQMCQSLSEIKNLKKMNSQGHYYRIRIGDYRLGLKLQGNTIYLLRFLHRKEIYKYFPENY